MKENYNRTLQACFVGYVVQAIVNNFVPLLFLTFQGTYEISLEKITLLVTFNFGLQLIIDLVSIGFVDRIGYRASMILAHLLAALGLILLTILPEVMSDPFVGLFLAVLVYAAGGGLLEVLVSPVVEACPTDNKEKAMSLLHSFYCWGHVGVVLVSTLFFTVFGISNWKILAVIWAIVPQRSGLYTGSHGVPSGRGREGNVHERAVQHENFLGADAYDAVCRCQRAGGEPVGINVCGAGTWNHQNDR